MLRPLLILACAIWVVLPLSAQETDRDPDAKLEPNATDCRRYIEIVDAEDGRSEVVIVWGPRVLQCCPGCRRADDHPDHVENCRSVRGAPCTSVPKDPKKLFISAVKEVE